MTMNRHRKTHHDTVIALQKASIERHKIKSPEELAKSRAEKEKTNQEIKSLLNIEREFDTLDVAKNKVNEFIS